MLANRWLFCYNIGIRCSIATPKKIMLCVAILHLERVGIWKERSRKEKQSTEERFYII